MKKLLDKINDLIIDLSGYEVNELNDFEKQNIKKRLNRKIAKKRNSAKKKIAIMAASIGVCILIGASSPAMANIKSFVFGFGFRDDEGSGMKNAESNGYIQTVDDVSFSDDKIDIKLNNIMVDSSIIALDYEINFKEDSMKLDNNIDIEKDFVYGCPLVGISLYDQNGNAIYRDKNYSFVDENGNTCETYGNNKFMGEKGYVDPIDGSHSTFEVDSNDNKKGHYKIIFNSKEARIPKIEKLNIKLDKFILFDFNNKVILTDYFDWNCNINLEEKFINYKTLEYKCTDSENIKVNKAMSLPTGIELEFVYSAKDHDPMNDILVTEDGTKIRATRAHLGDGDKYNILFDGITSFEDAEKFTLEIKNPDGITIDKVNFTK